jgi:hypothetical protein
MCSYVDCMNFVMTTQSLFDRGYLLARKHFCFYRSCSYSYVAFWCHWDLNFWTNPRVCCFLAEIADGVEGFSFLFVVKIPMTHYLFVRESEEGRERDCYGSQYVVRVSFLLITEACIWPR